MRNINGLIFILAGCLMIMAGCSSPAAPAAVNPGNATITEGVMTTAVDSNSKPTGAVTTSFPSDTEAVYCSFKVVGVAKEDLIKATWIYVSGEDMSKADTVLNETYDIVQVPEASYYLAFYFDKPVEGWTKGDYKVVLSINNKEKLSVPFKIE